MFDHPSVNDIDPDPVLNSIHPNGNPNDNSKYYTLDQCLNLNANSIFNLSLFNCNIRSYSKNGCKFEALFQIMSDHNHKPTFLIVTETWNTADTAPTCIFDGYTGFHTYRDNPSSSRGGVGGGVSIFFDNSFDGNPVPELSRCNLTIELCASRINLSKNYYILLLGIYRPHSDNITNFVIELENILNHDVVRCASLVLIGGDINIDISDPNSSSCLRYMALMQSHSFLPVITRPTRFDERFSVPDGSDPASSPPPPAISCSNLDHIWLGNMQSYLSGIILIDFTDHLPTFLYFNSENYSYSSDDKICITRRPYSDNNLQLLIDDLSCINWDQLIQSPVDPSTSIEKFSKFLDQSYCKHFPKKVMYISRKRINNPWVTSHLKKLSVKKSNYYKRLNLGEITQQENNPIRNEVNYAIRAAKSKYFTDAFDKNKNNMKKQWNIINKLMGRNLNPGKAIDKLVMGEVEYSDPSGIAEELNNFFASIADKLEASLPPICSTDMVHHDYLVNSFYLHSVTEHECLDVIKKLKLTGTDLNCMPIKIFKLIAHIFVPILCKVINSSFSSGIFPESLKLARVTPIFKKGDASDPNNYRPISSLPFLSKVYERLMANRIISFNNKFRIINLSQFGFQKNKSTADALFHLIEYIYNSLDEKKLILNIQIDLRKAFDTVNHEILLTKLFSYGFRGFAHEWLRSYLSDRKQFVRMKECSSSINTINIGVPQGSILGPILFLFYINDITKCSNILKTTLFADDTTLSMSHSKLENAIPVVNNELEAIYKWTINNRLSVNLEKTETMLISNLPNNETNSRIVFGGQDLLLTDCSTFLGVRLDNKLKFDNHISHVVGKLSKNIGIFSRIRHNMTQKARHSYYYSFIFPYLSYNVIFWGKTHDCYLEPIVLLQKRMIRLMKNADYLAHTDPLFSELKILKFSEIYTYFMSIYMFKSLENGNFQSSNRRSSRFHNYAETSFHRLTSTQRSVSFMGPRTWNSLPSNLRNMNKIGHFKRNLKEYLLSHYNTS